MTTSYHEDQRIDELVDETIGRVADKWTLLLIEALEGNGPKRFSQLGREIPRISQKMLTQTLRQMEREGLVERKVYAEVPPRVEYRLTHLGDGLAEAFCGVWLWAEANIERIEQARAEYDSRTQNA